MTFTLNVAARSILPSRAAALSLALETLVGGSTIFIVGDYGSGRTTFGRLLLNSIAKDNYSVYHITGSEALAASPFVSLATFAAQLPLRSNTDSVADIMANIAHFANTAPRVVLLDDAEFIDSESAAAIATLHAQLRAKLGLIVSVRQISSLPTDLRGLAYDPGTHIVELDELNFNDARVLLEDAFGDASFNSSAVNRLLNLSGGNPLHLRELALDAYTSDSLNLVRGYRTLNRKWVPSGRRIKDYVANRVAGWPEDLRKSIELIALTGPLPSALVTELIDQRVLMKALDEEVLVMSARNPRVDIAQSFDGPGAKAVLPHPEEVVQLGAGLTSELVLTALSHDDFVAHHDAIKATFAETDLPTGVLTHMFEVLRRHGLQPHADPPSTTVTSTQQLMHAAEEIVAKVLRGFPSEGVEIFVSLVGSDVWSSASSASQTRMIQAMFIAMMAEGSRPDVFDYAFESIDWHDVALDHTVFLAGRGALFLEFGDAAEASELFAQALALASDHEMTGFTFGLDAAAAVMTGDLQRARHSYAEFLRAPTTSGDIARFLVDLASVSVILALEGVEAARSHHEALLADAQQRGESYLVMRLLHNAWRLKLVDGVDHELLSFLQNAASCVEGSFARVLEQYIHVFAGEIGDGTAERLVGLHLASGRKLFAGEFAVRAASLALEAGDRSACTRLFGMFGEAVEGLPRVNTPSLGRVYIDSFALSERELEVCRLAASQLSNAEIAEQLFLSPRTVEGHLQRAYAKLGVADRRQLIV